MRITSLILKNSKGEIQEKIRKPKEKVNADNIGEFIEKTLKSNSVDSINKEALDFFIRRAEEMLDFFMNHNSR